MSNDEGRKQYAEIPICGKHVVVFFHGDDCLVCKQAGRASLEEENRNLREACESVCNYFWGTEPPILKEGDVQDLVEAALAGKSGATQPETPQKEEA